jgi:cell division protein FtsL
MTFRLSNLLWMLFLVVGAFGLYMVKYKVQAVKAQVASTEHQLNDETRNLQVLQAEWTFLNRPERLKQLAERYLDVKPMRGQQLAEFSSIPYAGVDMAAQDEPPSSATLVKLVRGHQGNAVAGDE